MKYFLDTNIISYLLKGSLNVKQKITDLIMDGHSVHIPVVAYYESKRELLATSAHTKLSTLQWFIQAFGIIDITTKTFDIASTNWANLKSTGLLIEDSDLFIGSSAVENNAILITNNANHLSRIQNIQIEIWNF